MKRLRILLILLATASAGGCQMFDRALHELQPHRLWRMNRQPAPGREDAAFYSIADDVAVREPGPSSVRADDVSGEVVSGPRLK